MATLVQPPLGKLAGSTSALLVARDQVVDLVDQWSVNWAAARTIGHAGKVTREYLEKQRGKAPRSIVTILDGQGARIAGGSQTNTEASFAWFLVVSGRLEDRTRDGLVLVGEALRFCVSNEWGQLDDSAFADKPTGMRWRSLYQDKDEKAGMSIWVIEWEQIVDLTTATRPPLVPAEPLERLDGDYEIPGEPNPDTIEVIVENP